MSYNHENLTDIDFDLPDGAAEINKADKSQQSSTISGTAPAVESAREPEHIRKINAWIAVETMSPVSVPNLDQINQGRESDMATLPIMLNGALPWEDNYPETEFPINRNGYFAYDVIFGDIGISVSNNFFARLYADDDSERIDGSGTSIIATLRLGPDGKFYEPKNPGNSILSISSFAVGFVMAANRQFDKMHTYSDVIQTINDMLMIKFDRFNREPVTQKDIQEIYYFILESIGLDERFVKRPAQKDDIVNRPSRVCGHYQKLNPDGSIKEERFDPPSIIMNSFFIESLQSARHMMQKGTAPELLRRYVGELPPTPQVKILENSKTLEGLLRPKNFPLGKWPQPGHHALVALQQATVNYALHQKGEDQSRAIGVNGPPGTGKTTLLKDIVAGLVVKRAIAMSKFDTPSNAFRYQSSGGRRSRGRGYLRIDPSIAGFEVVVASSNNAAVENISVEWTALDSVDQDTQPDVFAKLASRISKKESWGLISAALGNSGNRANFIKKIWMDQDFGLKSYFESILGRSPKAIISSNPPMSRDPLCIAEYSAPRSIPHAISQWQDSISQFNTILGELQALMDNREADSGRLDMDNYEQFHLSSPWLTQRENLLREKLFIAAMDIHRKFVNAAAKEMHECLENAIKYLNFPIGSEERAISSFAPLFLIVPVISTTFASVRTMMHYLPTNSIGWLIVDEAGQASPQSAVGAIMKVKNTLVVGDPIQVEPVVSTSEILISEIAKSYDLDIDSTMAPTASVQTFTDAASNLCAEYQSGFQTRRVGIPLLAHRRCSDPMFSISNKIGYGGLMVNAKKPGHSPIRDAVGPSQWIHVSSPAPGKWIEEEGIAVLDIIKKIASAEAHMDIYIITPFRIIENQMRRMIAANAEYMGISHSNALALSKRVGTVHKVQGREAEAVIMILGQQGKGRERARSWAGGVPNIPNVAVTRAKEVLYVVGNRHEWQHAGHFRDIDTMIDMTSIEDTRHQSPTTMEPKNKAQDGADILDIVNDDTENIRVVNL